MQFNPTLQQSLGFGEFLSISKLNHQNQNLSKSIGYGIVVNKAKSIIVNRRNRQFARIVTVETAKSRYYSKK